MAGYACSLCEGEEQATVLITPLTGGETMAVGEGCMAVAFTGMLAGHLQIDAEKLYAACERLIKAEAKKAPKVAAEGPPAVAVVTQGGKIEDGRAFEPAEAGAE